MSSDAAARLRALDPTRSFIVQAPAGSGKTELLTQRYLRLLATVEHPEQILAITFTRKAAAEMRSRILAAIASATGPAPDSPHKRSTWELACAVRARDSERRWSLPEHPSRLRIQTIDALNSSLARRLPILAGTGAAIEPTEDPQPLYESAATRLIERLGDDPVESANLEALIVHLGNRVDRLIDMLCELLKRRDQWLHPLMVARSHEQLRSLLEGSLAEVVERHLAELCNGLGTGRRVQMWQLARYAAENLLRDPHLSSARRQALEGGAARDEVPGEHRHDLDAWLAMVEVFCRANGQLYKAVTVKQGFPPADAVMKARMQEALAELALEPDLCQQLAALRHLPRANYPQGQWRILEALLDVLPLAVAELQLSFQRHGAADYVEGALRALQALGSAEEPTDLALAFDYRLQHLLVDEFQDTSFAQLELLERLTAGWTAGDGRTLFCVGDPMQSIYRFRQAEVGLFLELQRRGLANVPLERLRLTANFRSTRPIVEWVNRVFPGVLASRDDPEQGAVTYSPSVAAVDSDAGGVTVHGMLGFDALAEARQVVQLVREALMQNASSTVAILVTARTHVGTIARELTGAGIEFQAVEIEPLRDRPVVQDLIALTRALVHPADRTAWLAVLRAPWCGLTLEDLHAVAGGDRSATLPELLGRALAEGGALGAEGRERIERIHPALQMALKERGRWPLRDWIERTWNALAGPATAQREQDLHDAQAYFQRLEQIEIAGDLADVAQLEQLLERLFAQPRAQATARVEVMTIHKAKGLEFDTVIVPALHRSMRREDAKLLHWTRIAGARSGIVFAPVKADGEEPDPIYRWIELLERERAARERGRLLYVAATRAKRSLHLLGAAQTTDSEEGLQVAEPRSDSMLRMLWHEVGPVFEELAHKAVPARVSASDTAKATGLRRLPLDWRAPPADPPYHAAQVRLAEPADEQPEFDWVTETSRHVGTLVHRELERIVRSLRIGPVEPPAPASASQAQLSLFEARRYSGPEDLSALQASAPRLVAELAELGVPPEHCRSAAQRVVSAIQWTLTDPRGRWLLGLTGEIGDAESELALSGSFNGQLVEGVIDRTFVDRAGVRWIIDFKTSTHEGGGLAEFLDAEVERYRRQLQRYARLMCAFNPGQPVRAALYFPLLGAWREIGDTAP
jgi:ATP-dependent helicase/nuclease subunit A